MRTLINVINMSINKIDLAIVKFSMAMATLYNSTDPALYLAKAMWVSLDSQQ